MNSEELELSLRTEFESYLKGVLAGIRQDVSDFQKNFETEFAKHKTQLDESIRNLSTRFESEPEFDRAFSESVIEHLRLARDDGATITANAIGAAEKLKRDSAAPVSYDLIRDAINDITRQTSQSAILKSLVEQAGHFAPRGAFFIVKHDHFVGWKAFGKESDLDDRLVQEVHFPASADTLLAEAISSLKVQDVPFGSHGDDNFYLEPLAFGRPDRMYAIPLTARGRGVAVMYADYGKTGVNLNADALETIVRVAGLTVELLAASNEAKSQQDTATATAPAVERRTVERTDLPAPAAVEQPTPAQEEYVPSAEIEQPQFEIEHTAEATEYGSGQNTPEATVDEYTGEVIYETGQLDESAAVPVYDDADVAEQEDAREEVSYFEPAPEQVIEQAAEPEVTANDFAFATDQEDQSSGSVWPISAKVNGTEPAEEYSGNGNGAAKVSVAENVAEVVSAPAVRSRFSDRNVDLPINVSEDERRVHNDARRFARLLVSEIKLYNEQKVAEGREANDLYDRLREAIDRSREMYEKRVKPEVAAKFDYFHYELVNGLAEGSDERLGQSYPGASS